MPMPDHAQKPCSRKASNPDSATPLERTVGHIGILAGYSQLPNALWPMGIGAAVHEQRRLHCREPSTSSTLAGLSAATQPRVPPRSVYSAYWQDMPSSLTHFGRCDYVQRLLRNNRCKSCSVLRPTGLLLELDSRVGLMRDLFVDASAYS